MKCELGHDPNDATKAAIAEAERDRYWISVISDIERDADNAPIYSIGYAAASGILKVIRELGYCISKVED